MRRRVVITGVGIVSCLGNTFDQVAYALRNGESGIQAMPEWAQYGLFSLAAGKIGNIEEKVADAKIPRALVRGMSDGALYASLAAIDAVSDAKLDSERLQSSRTGVAIGSAAASCDAFYQAGKQLYQGDVRRVDPFTAFRSMSNTTSAAVANVLKVGGRSYSLASACGTGSHNIGHAFELIQDGRMDCMIAGGGEELSPMLATAFQALRLALATKYNDRPKEACRPYDKNRDGVVLSAGAGIVILEALEYALERNAQVRAELLGFGANSEGYDLAAPQPEGLGAARCIEMALREAGRGADEVDYINTHGTATNAGDIAEISAIRRVFGNAIPAISSTKSMTGHSLGASGAHELIYCIAMLQKAFLAPSINIDEIDPLFADIPIVRHATDRSVRIAVSTSFGFGGTNAALVLRRYVPTL